ncbi:hypothetical protein ACSVUS_003685 [Vibrio alginolyticus]|uniref:hypothetical protein n=1 Tax=Vibrio harveyi group TaxID=717610 RepID=UPI001C92DCB3|nr:MULTISPECIES: hypothetical protein [Vibrio harveyi group]EGR1143191.1 hypothetical protein [Vibrio parahaemolyticus]EIU6819615.1 hypothetical protein [Vibrio parahaemolyticus]EJL6724424.1 hypothetical protein [Vibrio alginolyticus]MBY4646943.1 hypothetical protein [Vibrio alginolyticus]MCR9487251.1 hypothetical protein [Vibrio alginolyticus]
MKISKDQWAELEEKMTYGYVDIKFKYKGFELSIQRVRTSESKSVLVVYINGSYKLSWGLIDRESEDRPSILTEVWKQRSMAIYKPKEIKEIEKVWGKRQAKKDFPNLHGRHTWYDPAFPKASVLCRQFKKLEGLELVEDSGFIEGGA